MEKQFYIIQVIPGSEHFVREEIIKRISELSVEEQFGDILIPESKTVNVFSAKKEETIEQLFPGYIVVSLIPINENFRLILTTPRVFKFLGGQEPSPLSKDEVENIMNRISGKVVSKQPVEVIFNVGAKVEIATGPFSGFSGTINSIDEIKQRFVVMVSIFGRLTPVEISFDQVKV